MDDDNIWWLYKVKEKTGDFNIVYCTSYEIITIPKKIYSSPFSFASKSNLDEFGKEWYKETCNKLNLIKGHNGTTRESVIKFIRNVITLPVLRPRLKIIKITIKLILLRSDRTGMRT